MTVAMKHAVDLHKGMTFPVVLAMMFAFDCWTTTAWVYLALHGSYGILWVMKSWTYPDPNWEVQLPIWKAVGVWVGLALYWISPVIITTQHVDAPNGVLCAALTANIIGSVLHYGSDAQKYYTLQVRRGLITTGFFARTRNPNYLGEMLIYGSFAALSLHWLPWLVCLAYWGAIFTPNMLAKDRSMSRYEEWDAYTRQTWMLLPKLF